MDANEARRIAFEYNTNAAESQYSDIKTEIDKAAKSGKYFIWIMGYLDNDVHIKLEREGYSIKSQSHRNETETKISW